MLIEMETLGQADRDALVTKLEACRAVQDPEVRVEVLARLPAELASRIRGDGPLRVVANRLVTVCAEWPNGLHHLREAVRHFEGETLAMQALDAHYASLGLPATDRESVPEGEEAAGDSLAALVAELVDRLAEQRKAGSPRAQTSELTGRLDWLVSTIKRRFAPKEGAIVAGATLLRVIGSGNFGTIWHAEDRETGEKVAVKIFRLERLSEGQMLSRFRRSIRAMRRLGEKKRLGKRDDTRGHIVQYRCEDPSGLAFAMDYLSQGNLEHIDQQGWTLERKLEVMLAVCSAVHYAHQNGVIHRDIKPANIVLDDERQPVLTDFDIADIKWATSLSTTVEGGLGTPVFAAPEQLVDADLATEAADVYSLGRLLYYLLLERSPGYEVEKDPSLDNLSDHRPALVEIVRKATQYVPQRRYESVKEMMSELERCHTGAAAARARMSKAWRWVRRNRALLTIAALVIAGAVGFAVYQAGVAKDQRTARERAERAEKDQRAARERAERAEKQLAEVLETITGLKATMSDIRNKAIDIDAEISRREQALALARQTKNADELAAQEAELGKLRAKRDQLDKDLQEYEKKLRRQDEEVKRLLAAQRRAARAAAAAKAAEEANDAADAGAGVAEQGTLVFATDMVGAEVYIDGTKLTTSPNKPIEQPAGEYTVVVQKEEAWWSGRVTVTAGQATKLAATLQSYKATGRSHGVAPPAALADSDAKMEFVRLSEGEFTMGSPPDEASRDEDETMHRVRVSAFEMSKTEVTQKQWTLVMGENPSDCDYGCSDGHPVQNVSWDEAIDFLNRLSEMEKQTPCYQLEGGRTRWDQSCTGYRLPTEAEWEYACRAGSQSAYSFGDDDSQLGEYAWYEGNAGGKAHAVSGKKSNRWGLSDMHGNVFEWVWDAYGRYSLDGKQSNPRGSRSGRNRVLRGGSFYSSVGAGWLRCAFRGGFVPWYRSRSWGFRVARGPRRQR